MYEQVKCLYENELWSSIVHVAPYATISGSDAENEDKCAKKRHGMLVMIADAYFECRDFKRAEPLYKEAIQLKKQFKVLKKSDGSAADHETNLGEGKLSINSSDVEVKYKLHLCYLNMNQVWLAAAFRFQFLYLGFFFR